MSLLEDNFEEFAVVERTRVPDGEGGLSFEYAEGVRFQAHARLDSSVQAEIAKLQGVTSLYTITTRRAVNLEAKEVIKRLSDNKIFRITSDGDDNKTPKSAGLDMRQVKAEEWVLPND